MMIRGLLIICCLYILPHHMAQANEGGLAVGIASNKIDVTVGFNGSSIELFGDRRDKNSVVAVIIEGPKKDITIWKKMRIMGTWVNGHYVKFKEIPIYYQYAISATDIDGKLLKAMLENRIGHDALFQSVEKDQHRKLKDIKPFQEEFLKKNKKHGVFFEKPAEIKFLNDNFFRVSFKIPPSAQTGDYKIHSFLIKNGKVVDQSLELLTVEQVGLNAFIYKSAHSYSLIYALVCIFFAFFFGWLVSVLRVKP